MVKYRLPPMRTRTRLTVEFPLDDLVEAILGLDNDTIVEVIKEIDRGVAAYEFTEKLEKYFKEEMKKENEAAED